MIQFAPNESLLGHSEPCLRNPGMGKGNVMLACQRPAPCFRLFMTHGIILDYGSRVRRSCGWGVMQ